MMPSQLRALFFDGLAALVLLFLIFVKSKWSESYFKKYLIAVTAVYLSGTLFVTILTFVASQLPLRFVMISEFSIIFMFVMSFYTVIRLGDNLEAIRGEMKDKHEDNE